MTTATGTFFGELPMLPSRSMKISGNISDLAMFILRFFLNISISLVNRVIVSSNQAHIFTSHTLIMFLPA